MIGVHLTYNKKKRSRRNYWGKGKEDKCFFLTHQVISKVIIIILPITVIITVNTYCNIYYVPGTVLI